MGLIVGVCVGPGVGTFVAGAIVRVPEGDSMGFTVGGLVGTTEIEEVGALVGLVGTGTVVDDGVSDSSSPPKKLETLCLTIRKRLKKNSPSLCPCW